MTDLKEFASSSNGDKWFVEKEAEGAQIMVVHRGNPSSGGHETRSTVEAFMNQEPFGPEREALSAFLNSDNDAAADATIGQDGATPFLRLATEYLRLGGCRLVKVDDNIVSIRLWEDEPATASAFWEKHIAPLDDKARREVELHLPSMSDG